MIIMRCDRCGKEVAFSAKRYSLDIKEAQSHSGSYITMRSRDLCCDCYNALLRFLESDDLTGGSNDSD